MKRQRSYVVNGRMSKRIRIGRTGAPLTVDVASYALAQRRNRRGYSSVARTRGAAVTGEMKYIDESQTFTIPASTDWTATEADDATTLCLHGVPQVGAAINQRIGKKIKVLKLRVHGSVSAASQANQTAADQPALVRLIVFQDMQTNSAQAQGEQLMSTLNSAVFNPLSFQTTDNMGRFKVLKDKTFVLQNPNMTYDGTNVEQVGLIKHFKFNLKFKYPVEIQFNATNGGTIADIVSNSFHMIATTTSADLVPQVNWVSRLCYKE